MKPTVFCVTVLLSAFSASVAFADAIAPVALETVPPPAPPAPAVAAEPAALPANPDRTETETEAAAAGSTRLEAIAGRTQALGFAVGIRVGHRTASNVYLGGTAMAQTGVANAVVTYPAMELGYDAKLGDARFMPYVGVGPMVVIPTEGDAKVQVTPVVYPGFAFRYESEKSPLVAGADVRFLYLTETDTAAVSLNLTAGARF